MKIDRLKSTIVIGIFLIISTFFVVWLLSYDYAEAYRSFNESLNDPNNIEGGLILFFLGFASIGLFVLIAAAFVPAILCLINSVISIMFSIRNRKSTNKTIRIINYCYDAILLVYIVFCTVKLILFSQV